MSPERPVSLLSVVGSSALAAGGAAASSEVKYLVMSALLIDASLSAEKQRTAARACGKWGAGSGDGRPRGTP